MSTGVWKYQDKNIYSPEETNQQSVYSEDKTLEERQVKALEEISFTLNEILYVLDSRLGR